MRRAKNYSEKTIIKKAIWSWKESYFRHPKGGLNKFNITIIFCYVLNNIIVGSILVFCFKFALDANINQGILTTLFGLTAFFSALGAYFLFNERLKVAHIIGMSLMLVCIIGLSFGSSSKNSTIQIEKELLGDALSSFPIYNSNASKGIYTFLAMLFAIL